MLKASLWVADPQFVTDDPKPGYDFFVSPPAAAPPRPAPEQAPPAAIAPPAQRESADRRWALNPDTFSSQDTPWRMPRWASIGVSVVAALLIVSIAVAVALPMIKRHTLDSQYENTSISLPKNFNGQSGESSGSATEQLSKIAAGFSSTSARVYGKNSLGLILVVAFRPSQAMSDEDQADARAQLAQQLTAGTTTGMKLDLTPTSDAGRLGGYFGCGKITPATVCIGTDPGAMVAIVLGPTVEKPQSVALKLREASVTRS